jgi:hypothetical protein
MRTAVELNSTAVLFFEEIARLEAADYKSAGSGKRGDCFAALAMTLDKGIFMMTCSFLRVT